MPRAVCLVSGGLDSATALYQALADDFEVIALTVHYGQLHEREIRSAKQIVRHLDLEHFVVPIALPWKGSALLDTAQKIPMARDAKAMASGIPNTYVPARNSIFLSLAASLAEARGAEAIYIGANILDYSGYPDCRPEFLTAFETMIRAGTRAGQEGKPIRVAAPLLKLNKREIIMLGAELGVPYEWTWSCYQGKDEPCGACDSCQLRAKGFRGAGMKDPALSVGARHASP